MLFRAVELSVIDIAVLAFYHFEFVQDIFGLILEETKILVVSFAVLQTRYEILVRKTISYRILYRLHCIASDLR